MAAVYSIYIRYYQNGSNVSTTETKLYDIPFSNGNANVLIEPKVKNEMGKTGTFEFSMYYNHPYYNAMLQMRTMLRVEYYGETIFYGRVLTIDTDHLTSKKTVHCEGCLAFLMDSVIEGAPDENREYTDGATYIQKLLQNHNTLMAGANPPKQIARGYAPGNYGSKSAAQQIKMEDSRKYGSSGWSDTASAFSTLTKEYGGYLRMRYVNGQMYLDWMDSYFNDTVGDRIIEVTNNAISLNSSDEVENIFTYVLPIGKNLSDSSADTNVYLNPKYLKVPDIVNHYTDAELNVGYHKKSDYVNAITNYGAIYKTVSFGNAETTEELSKWAWDWIKNNFHGGFGTFTATALDLKVTGQKSNAMLCGDRCTVRLPKGNGTFEDRILTITDVEYDLHKPENNTYTIGIPSGSELNKTYGEKKSSEKSSSGGGGGAKGGGGGGRSKSEEEIINDKVDHNFELYTVRQSQDNVEYQAYKEKYGDKAAYSILKATALMLDQSVDDSSTPTRNKEARRQVHTMMFDANNGTLTGFKPLTDEELKEIGGITNPNLNKIMADRYAVTASMVVDTRQSSLTLREQWDNTMKTLKENPSLLVTNPLKEAVRLGIAKRNIENNQEQYGEIALSFVDRNSSNSTTSKAGSGIKLNGGNGKLTGGELALAKNLGETIDQIAADTTGTKRGTVNMSGSKAQMELTDLDEKTAIKMMGPYGKLVGARINLASSLGTEVDNISSDNTGKTRGSVNMDGTKAQLDLTNSSKQTAMMLTGNNGKFSGMNIGLGKSAGDIIDKLGGGDKGTVNLMGPLAQIDTTNLTDQSQTTNVIDGNGTNGEGSISAGWDKTKNEYKTKMNKSVTYIGPDGQQKTASGFMSSEDFEFKEYLPSLKSNMISVNVLLADYAQIGTLKAMDADIEKIKTTYITADYITTKLIVSKLQKASLQLGNMTIGGNLLVDGNITSTATITGSTVKGTLLYLGNVNMSEAYVDITDGSYVNNAKTITFKKASGASSKITFSRATTLQVEYGGDNKGDTATYTVTATPQENTVTGSFKVHQNKTAVWITDPNGTIRARIDNPQYDNGWTAAYSKLSLPSTSNTTDTMTVKYPSVTVDTAGTDINYKVSVDDSYAYIKRGSVTVARATNNAYNKGYEAGWKKAASYVSRSGNEIYGPSPKSIDVSKKYYVANYSESSYTAASHSDSYTSASLKIGDTNYSSQKLSVDVSYLSGKLEYNPSSHAHSYTEASYSASSFSWTDSDT